MILEAGGKAVLARVGVHTPVYRRMVLVVV